MNHQTLKEYLDNPDRASARTRELVQRWADGADVSRGTPPVVRLGSKDVPPELASEIARINQLPMDEALRTWRIEALAALYRDAARLEAEKGATIRADGMRQAEVSAAERARAASAAEQGALERAKAVHPPVEKTESREVPPPAPGKKRKRGGRAG